MLNEFNKILVVGNRLKNFAKTTGAMSVSDLENFIASNELRDRDKKIEVMIGQGISDSKLNSLYKSIKQSNLDEKIIIKKTTKSIKRTENKLTHKRFKKNTMISEPVKLEENTYESMLMLDDRCAEMSDHVTGLHIQGMVLIEAARQMTLAVTEKFFLEKDLIGKMYFLTNSLETKFNQFVFPVDVKAEYTILEKRGIKNLNQTFTVAVKFIQDDKVGAEIVYKFSVCKPDIIKNIEQKMAKNLANNIYN